VSADRNDAGKPRSKHTADFRELRDPRDMRALAHPTRLALLEVLSVHGPMTATQAAELVAESPSSCSFHLRTLARHNFVEETGEGRGRERPWRVVAFGTSMSGPYDDYQTEVAARVLSDMFVERQLERLRVARANRSSLPPEWAREQSGVESLWWVTPEELHEINEAVLELALRFSERLTDPSRRPPTARPVEMVYHVFRSDFGRPFDDA
jgi:DNA-binding transcriptional ArsR family regulator